MSGGLNSDSRPGLTGRERDVTRILCAGAPNREIAHRLSISERTVEVHLSNVFRKLQVRSRTELVAVLVGAGWPI